MIDLVLGYHRANKSRAVELLLSRTEEMLRTVLAAQVPVAL
jgi:hypothetical protein